MNPSLAFELLKVTEQAAIKAFFWKGKGDKNSADKAATEAMREILNSINIKGTVVIGEGEMDEAPMLYIGEKLGKGEDEIDIAVDPIDGTTLTSKNRENAISVIGISEKNSLLNAPDMYMKKIGVGPKAKGAIDITKDLTYNLKEISKALNKKPEEINIVILERDRHNQYIKEAREFGARVTLITDGDVCPVIGAGLDDIDIDVMFGIGGAPEGVLAAIAAKCLGGDFQGILHPESEEEIERCKKMGITDIKKVFKLNDLVKSDKNIFCLTGITDGYIVKGVKKRANKIITESLILNSFDFTPRFITGYHNL
ncbi:MAG TPA: class II fructose-bisphosphatase [Spirochaetota bacterium]|nr:class II fructose-bisphosphatase [Spirochaetota bacterium]HOM39147.1 class II fructose-bisphosphatase [Spirochaetota bacterium]HPQ48324.1 class II fructose-bisphosphatase [Spirochaetota bacterium]